MLSEELGCSPTLSMLLGREAFYFDPLGIATDSNFARLREAELKHGRVSMLANLHLVFPPLLRRINLLLLDQQQQQLLQAETERSKIMTVTTAIDIPDKFPTDSIVDNLLFLPEPIDYVNMIVTCAFLEGFIFFQRDPRDMPGDYGTGYFGVRDKGIHERSLVVELEHARLAMLAVVGQLTAELVSGKSWMEQWDDILQQITDAAEKMQ
ncbi:expressed unknown protein [Seminavis robusta]|uniref:Uncharacterized protein n=1 Tax=Seminavis robusta TaxID=568900 RepID=A0A9N8EU33_9STRA|nr:expressed unknown protein [Seminavis robusta]|eukprot:Sro1880_g303240.1 n/a (209) ;mRNA; r:20137-20763